MRFASQCGKYLQEHPCTCGDGLLVCGRVHIGFAEKDGNSFLSLVDSHSKWIEVAHMTSTSANSTIDQLRVRTLCPIMVPSLLPVSLWISSVSPII